MDATSGVGYAVVAALAWGGYLFALKRYFDLPSTVLVVAADGFDAAWYLPFAAATLPADAASTLGGVTAESALVVA